MFFVCSCCGFGEPLMVANIVVSLTNNFRPVQPQWAMEFLCDFERIVSVLLIKRNKSMPHHSGMSRRCLVCTRSCWYAIIVSFQMLHIDAIGSSNNSIIINIKTKWKLKRHIVYFRHIIQSLSSCETKWLLLQFHSPSIPWQTIHTTHTLRFICVKLRKVVDFAAIPFHIFFFSFALSILLPSFHHSCGEFFALLSIFVCALSMSIRRCCCFAIFSLLSLINVYCEWNTRDFHINRNTKARTMENPLNASTNEMKVVWVWMSECGSHIYNIYAVVSVLLMFFCGVFLAV